MGIFVFDGTVRWSETDASGRFHYSNALLWAENAEHALCREIDAGAPISQMPRRSVSADYHHPFLAGDHYTVRLWVEKLGNSSVTYGWKILNGTTLAVEGRHTAVHINDTGRAQPILETLRKGLSGFLGERGDD